MLINIDGAFFGILTQSKVPIGIITLMTDAEFCLAPQAVAYGLYRHAMSDWGQAGEELRQTNDEALKSGGQVMSLFTSEPLKIPFRIITDGDRRNTFVMVESEYPDYEAGCVRPLGRGNL